MNWSSGDPADDNFERLFFINFDAIYAEYGSMDSYSEIGTKTLLKPVMTQFSHIYMYHQRAVS